MPARGYQTRGRLVGLTLPFTVLPALPPVAVGSRLRCVAAYLPLVLVLLFATAFAFQLLPVLPVPAAHYPPVLVPFTYSCLPAAVRFPC